MRDLLDILRLAREEEAANPPEPIAFEVVISPWWRNPHGRVSVSRLDRENPTRGQRQYLHLVETWLIARFDVPCRLFDTTAVAAMGDDLEPMIRGALLKGADREIEAPFTIAAETARTTPVRMLELL